MPTSTCAITKNSIVKYLIMFLPDRIKRMTLLSSLTASVMGEREVEGHLLHRLSSLLKISTTGEDAMRLPVYWSRVIWSNKVIFQEDLNNLINCEEKDVCASDSAERIANAIPSWFRYNTPQAIKQDLIALFSKRNNVFEEESIAA